MIFKGKYNFLRYDTLKVFVHVNHCPKYEEIEINRYLNINIMYVPVIWSVSNTRVISRGNNSIVSFS